MTTSTVSGNKDRTTNKLSVFQNRMGQIYTVRMYSTYSIRLHPCVGCCCGCGLWAVGCGLWAVGCGGSVAELPTSTSPIGPHRHIGLLNAERIMLYALRKFCHAACLSSESCSVRETLDLFPNSTFLPSRLSGRCIYYMTCVNAPYCIITFEVTSRQQC
jgi:hypothetical protein